MLQPLSAIIDNKRAAAWEESDARHFIQQWLREQTKTQQLYCENFRGSVAQIRAASPAVRMTAKILEYDLRQALASAGGPELKEVKVMR